MTGSELLFKSPDEIVPSQTPAGQIMEPTALEIRRREIRAGYAQALEASRSIVVKDEDSNIEAVLFGRLLQASTRELEEFYKPVKQAYDAQKKVVLDWEKADLAEIKLVKDLLARQTLDFQEMQQRLAQEEQRLARLKAIEEAEERRLAEAIELEAQGLTREAAERLEETPMEPPVIVTAPLAKPSGSIRRETWKAVVEDKAALIRAVAAGKVPQLALEPAASWLNTQAGQFHEGLNYPGVRVQKEVSAHFRA